MYLCRGTKYFTLIVLIFLQTCNAWRRKHYHCPPSACGQIRNISYPFGLNTDSKHCRLPGYELACEGNQTIKWSFSKKLYVQAINYNIQTIRLVDPALQTQDDLCSFRSQLTFDQYNSIFKMYYYRYPYEFEFEYTASEPILIFNCPFAVNNSKFVEISGCKLNGYTYLRIGEMSASEVSDGCREEFIGLTSWPNIICTENNISLSDFHQAILYGFELHYYLPSSRPRFLPKIVSTSLLQFHGVLVTLIHKLQYSGIFGRKMSKDGRTDGFQLYMLCFLIFNSKKFSEQLMDSLTTI